LENIYLNTADFLQKVDVFSLLGPEEIKKVIDSFHLIEVEEEKTLFKEGDEGNELYIVKSGKVAVSIRHSDGVEREIVELKKGDFFGEMSIFENAPRSATCYAKEKSVLLKMKEEDFFKLIKHFPLVAIKIMYRMLNITTKRLRDSSGFLSNMVTWGERARKRSITDELTGVYNRRFLDDALVDYFEAARNTGRPLTVVMVDLDYFRNINELYGDKTGDRTILSAVDVFKKVLRKDDIAARYGGDEFTFILPDTGPDKGFELAEKIRLKVSKLTILEKKEGPIRNVTTSQGLASFPKNAEELITLMEKADKALYRAKNEGRNRVTCAE
jgi:diguanylate cyclase (GGDEF)-like protein